MKQNRRQFLKTAALAALGPVLLPDRALAGEKPALFSVNRTAGLFVSESVMGSNHDLFGVVPGMILFFGHPYDSRSVHPTHIVVRSLYAIPTRLFQHPDRHAEQTLRDHLGRKVIVTTQVANGQVNDAERFLSQIFCYFFILSTGSGTGKEQQQAQQAEKSLLHKIRFV